MRSVSVRLDDLRTMILNIGFVGENEHKRFIFDCKKMFDQYPRAAASMTVQPPEGEAYPAIIERDGDYVIWDVTNSDLAHDGDGELQLAFTQEPHVAKSCKGQIHVCPALVPSGEIPEGIDDFLTRAGAALTAIPETINEALEEAKESGEFDGADGVSPTVATEAIEGGHRVTITDADGEKSFDVMDGTAADVIDDQAGAGDTDVTFSADKLATDHSSLLSAINGKEDKPGFEVEFTLVNNTLTANKTLAEFVAAYNAGKTIKAIYDNGRTKCELTSIDYNSTAEEAVFNGVISVGGTPRSLLILWTSWGLADGYADWSFVDNSLDSTSYHPVQNKVISAAISQKYDDSNLNANSGISVEVDVETGKHYLIADVKRSDITTLQNAIDGKQTKPATAGTAGQVLGLNSNLEPVWVDQSGGGGQTDIGLSVVDGKICVTFEEVSA